MVFLCKLGGWCIRCVCQEIAFFLKSGNCALQLSPRCAAALQIMYAQKMREKFHFIIASHVRLSCFKHQRFRGALALGLTFQDGECSMFVENSCADTEGKACIPLSVKTFSLLQSHGPIDCGLFYQSIACIWSMKC